MEELNDQVQTAAGALDPDAQDRAAELAERTRELVQAAESMEERARQAMEGQEQAGEQQGARSRGVNSKTANLRAVSRREASKAVPNRGANLRADNNRVVARIRPGVTQTAVAEAGLIPVWHASSAGRRQSAVCRQKS